MHIQVSEEYEKEGRPKGAGKGDGTGCLMAKIVSVPKKTLHFYSLKATVPSKSYNNCPKDEKPTLIPN